jgi:predicted helicase
MSQLLINQYLRDLAKLRQVSGTHRESVVREAFKDLLKNWGRSLDLTFIAEYELVTTAKERRYVDGALLHTLRVPFGYWEAKDEQDDIDAEIATKFRRGYPKTNIIFEDSSQAVLIQDGGEVMRCSVEDVPELERLLNLFFGYERPEIEAFRRAVIQFNTDLPAVLEALRSMIERSYQQEPEFRKAAAIFLAHAKEAINPRLVDADVREMLIQHILTGEVFEAVFPDATYHENNSVARELHKLEATFFTGDTKHQTLKALAPYYGAIRRAATEISTHHEKQAFLKAVYENFYKVYNPKAADRLGVIYTPNEIVRFMIQSADWLCELHFKRSLIDKDVDILDPATGTGTYITELIEHFGGQPSKLSRKYRLELHANEVAILPYYVANLNIEATFAAAMGTYEEFPGLCFVDTLDNTSALRKHKGHIDDMFGTVSDDNIKRIRQQNSRRISVIIGNPPYNANQLNENENNKNREYPEIDKRIKETYIASSTAQKTKLYDMYARFFRWASDRLDENGVLALITNRSFIESRTFDGFRALVAKEFNEIRLVDLGGDVRANPKLSGTTHNVFGIQTGVAISFMVRRAKQKGCSILYARRPEFETAAQKLSFLANTRLDDVDFEPITPDEKNNWINLSNNDFGSLAPLATREAKRQRDSSRSKVIFGTFASGIKTNRDSWVYDFSGEVLARKVAFINAELKRIVVGRLKPEAELSIKWSRDLKLKAQRGLTGIPEEGCQVLSQWRPFVKKLFWVNKTLSDILTDNHFCSYGPLLDQPNPTIAFLCVYSQNPLAVLATTGPFDYCMLKRGNGGTESVARWILTENGDRRENITDWALETFTKRYRIEHASKVRSIGKDSIFHYVYGVLHDPIYREKYALNLRREFPRIPFYSNFWRWSDWGKELFDLHVGYESAKPFAVIRADVPDDQARRAQLSPKPILRSDAKAGTITLDSETSLSGVPPVAWDYKLGNRSALEWILDQYKETTPKDPTVRAMFNNYRFADYKEVVIDLLARVTTVSIETTRIVSEMRVASRADE